MGSNPILSGNVTTNVATDGTLHILHRRCEMLPARVSGYGVSKFDLGEVPKLAEGAPLERE